MVKSSFISASKLTVKNYTEDFSDTNFDNYVFHPIVLSSRGVSNGLTNAIFQVLNDFSLVVPNYESTDQPDLVDYK